MEDGASDIILQDLPYFVTDDEIRKEMQKYGEVIEIWEKRHPEGTPLAGILMGVRVVRMIRKNPINSHIIIGGEMTQAMYRGQIQTCHRPADADTESNASSSSVTVAAKRKPGRPPKHTKVG
uniref:RRM domain-containing protein n=1 Tax=Anopheles atroparvus TaxID=41427 RepID=A0A182IM86_ANOAO